MSLVPILTLLARELENEHRSSGLGDWDRYLDDDFGFGINPVDIFRPRLMHHRRSMPLTPYLFPRRRHHNSHGDGNENESTSAVNLAPTCGKDGFQVSMNVAQFKPSELTVKTIDNTVVVEGKHEEREDDHGLIQRHIVRKYTLPKDFDAKDVSSTISSDGILTIKAPPPANRSNQNERIVQIQQTGPAHLNIKQPETAKAVKQTQNGGSAAPAEVSK